MHLSSQVLQVLLATVVQHPDLVIAPNAMLGFKSAQLAALVDTNAAALTAAQVAKLNSAQISKLPVADINDHLLEHGILGGYDLGKDYPTMKDHMLISITEIISKDEIDQLCEILEEISND